MSILVGKKVNATGYGLMGLTYGPHPPPESQCIEALNTALMLGANFWNGGEIYGTHSYNSLHMLHAYFSNYPEAADKVVLSIKGGMQSGTLIPDGSEENLRRSVDECIKILDGKKGIDIFECARLDRAYPIEETIKILAKMVQEGKFKSIGLSEVDADLIRRAHKIHPISAVEVELSIWATDILENNVAATCAELGIPVIAYSPLGRGALTGAINSTSDIPEGDFRRRLPKFQDEALKANKFLIDEVLELAKKKGMTGAQIALAWIKSLNGRPGMPTIIPIPGGKTKEKVTENMQDVPLLTAAEMEEIERIIKRNRVVGSRY